MQFRKLVDVLDSGKVEIMRKKKIIDKLLELYERATDGDIFTFVELYGALIELLDEIL